MTTRYVNLKSQLTDNMNTYAGIGCSVYRTRTTCGCPDGHNRRDAILVADPDTHYLVETIIRCKACARKEAQHGKL
jgi:hypothetical protein